MSVVFLITLALVPISAYICKHSADDIAHLAAAIFWVSLVLSLVFAPWQLQLFLLILVLLSNKRHLLASEPLTKAHEEKKIQLVYRGIKYEPTPPSVEVTKDEMVGKYRGQLWRVRA